MTARQPVTRLVLVRHPRVSAAGLCYGRTDLPIADPASIPPLAAEIRAVGGMVWTSPAQRCRAVAAAAGMHRLDARLQELDFGEWEGRLWEDVPRAALDAWAADLSGFSAPGGETGAALVARVASFYCSLPGGSHVVISHGGPLKVLAALASDRPVDLSAPAQPVGSIRRYVISPPCRRP